MKRMSLITPAIVGTVAVAVVAAFLLATPVLAHGSGGPGKGRMMGAPENATEMQGHNGNMGKMRGGLHEGANHEAMQERMAAMMGQHGDHEKGRSGDCPIEKKGE